MRLFLILTKINFKLKIDEKFTKNTVFFDISRKMANNLIFLTKYRISAQNRICPSNNTKGGVDCEGGHAQSYVSGSMPLFLILIVETRLYLWRS